MEARDLRYANFSFSFSSFRFSLANYLLCLIVKTLILLNGMSILNPLLVTPVHTPGLCAASSISDF